MTLITLYAVPC